MADTDDEMRERLHEIWGEWGLRTEHASIAAQLDALAPIHAWLSEGDAQPEIVIRAAQCLLADPERPGLNKRASWTFVRKAVEKHWASASTAAESVLSVQALLLAAWPYDSDDRTIVRLLDGAWEVMVGRERQQKTLCQWRDELGALEPEESELPAEGAKAELTLPEYSGAIPATAAAGLQYFNSNQATSLQYMQFGTHLVQVLNGYKASMEEIGGVLGGLIKGIKQALVDQESSETLRMQSALAPVEGMRNKFDLLWWGQARYCRSLRKPYRHIRDAGEALWWAAWEAAGIARDIEVEPAAAYLVETLSSLGHRPEEKQPLGRWMEGLHESLKQAEGRAPALCERLTALVKQDALGLPVSWVRLQAARREPLTDAPGAVLLPLDAEIDRGQWATWVFREALLDLHLEADE